MPCDNPNFVLTVAHIHDPAAISPLGDGSLLRAPVASVQAVGDVSFRVSGCACAPNYGGPPQS